jgi:hypothetical protein
MSGPDPAILSYQRPLPRPRFMARLIRWLMITIAVWVFAAGVIALLNPLFVFSDSLGAGIIGTPFAPVVRNLRDNLQSIYIPEGAGYLAIFLASQWLFLVPRGRWRLESIGGGRLTRTSALAAGFIAMLLTVGLLATLMELPGWWRTMTLVDPDASRDDITQKFWTVWPVMLALWIVWGLLFWRYARALDRYTALSRITRFLVAGTFLELIVAAPAHAWIVPHSDDDCYCTRGSYTGVVFGCTALVWLFGPGVVLLMLRELRRRERMVMNPSTAQAQHAHP